jgi:chemotaxis regulatin CheY-phosphate phosphatase CheZ
MNTTSLTGGNGTSEMVDRAHQMVDKAVDQLAPVVQGASTAAHQTIDKVASAAAPVAEWASENGRQLATKTSELAEVCSAQVRARPITMLAGAVAIGYIAGRMLRN